MKNVEVKLLEKFLDFNPIIEKINIIDKNKKTYLKSFFNGKIK